MGSSRSAEFCKSLHPLPGRRIAKQFCREGTFYERLAMERDPDRPADHARRDAYLRKEMKDVWEKNRSVYGARKLWHAMKREKLETARNAVE